MIKNVSRHRPSRALEHHVLATLQDICKSQIVLSDYNTRRELDRFRTCLDRNLGRSTKNTSMYRTLLTHCKKSTVFDLTLHDSSTVRESTNMIVRLLKQSFRLIVIALCSDELEQPERTSETTQDESRIVVNKPLLPWSQRLQYAADAAEGMQYLHSRNPPLLHRDLKSLNILVKGGRAKICDFGASKALQLGGFEDEYDLDSSSSRGQHVRSYTLGSLSSSSKTRNKKKNKKNTSLSTFKTLLGSSSSSTSIKTPLLKSASAALSFASIPSSSTDEEEDINTNNHRTTIESMSRKPRLMSSSSFSQAPLMTTKIGTPQWLAPELLCSDSENVPYSLPIDVYVVVTHGSTVLSCV